MKLLLAVILIGLAIQRTTAQEAPLLPFQIENPKNVKWNPQMAARVWDAALRQVATELNPTHPREIHPNLTLQLGAASDSIFRDKEDHFTMTMVRWDALKFAYGCVWAATSSSITKPNMATLARQAFAVANASVDVDELRK